MSTTTTSPTASQPAPRTVNTIAAWDHLEDTVDRLADIVDDLLARHDEQLVCSLQFPEAEASPKSSTPAGTPAPRHA